MKKKLTQAQIQKRANVNGKILKFGCLPILALFAIIIIIAIAAPTPDTSKYDELLERISNVNDISEFDNIIVEMNELSENTENDSLKNVIQILISKQDELKRTVQINKQFSSWDGSHINLKKSVKDNLKDPSSFEHVNTEYQVNNDNTLTVHMKYRGKNSFNATITEDIWVKTDLNGNILEVLK